MPLETIVKSLKELKPSSKDVVNYLLKSTKKQTSHLKLYHQGKYHFPSVDVTQKHCMCVCKITTEGQITPPSATTHSICKHNKFEYVALSRA